MRADLLTVTDLLVPLASRATKRGREQRSIWLECDLKLPCRREALVSLTFAGWNRITQWLRRLEALLHVESRRRIEAKSPTCRPPACE